MEAADAYDRAVNIRAIMVVLIALGIIVGTAGPRPAMAAFRDEDSNNAPRKIEAYPIQSSISVNGRLDETVWEEARVASGFTQYEPDEGANPTFPTEVRIVYGASALYIGARLFDDYPNRINTSLSRRDELSRADRFLVYIDSYFNRQTAFVFGVSAGGVQVDWLMDDGSDRRQGRTDTSWDAIWYSDVEITPEGWTVEMKIPYSMLRFAESGDMKWGIQFRREIPRLSEIDDWVYVPRTESEYVANFGILTGMGGIESRRNIQVTPYTMSRLQTNRGADGLTQYNTTIDVGADVKVGLSSNFTLDATINPDFGQVESDPAVLNLSTFETFFPEKRPFFLEGAQIFDFDFVGNDGTMLYTRRIGGSRSPVIGALKLTGRTQSGYSIGVLGATTGRDFKPGRYYMASRFKREFGSNSYVGASLTGYKRLAYTGLARETIAGGVDWDIRFANQAYQLVGYLVGSRRATDGSVQTGYSAHLGLGRLRGTYTGTLHLIIFDDQFNVNDVGQMRQNNMIRIFSPNNYLFNNNQPFGPFRRASMWGFFYTTWSYDGRVYRGTNAHINTNWHLKNFHSFGIGFDLRDLGGYDVRETRGLWPYENVESIGIGAEYESDSRKSYRFSPQIGYSWMMNGGSELELSIRGEWNASSRLSLSAEIEHSRENDVEAWMVNEPLLYRNGQWFAGPSNRHPTELSAADFSTRMPNPGRLSHLLSGVEPAVGSNRYYVPIFGRRDTRELSLQLRANFTFLPRLSLQVFNQLFAARGRYDQFGILTDPTHLPAYRVYPKRHDFAIRSYISNIVLRWEYQPGATLFLVWSQNRRLNQDSPLIDPTVSSPYQQSTSELLRETFNLFPTNIFLVKIEYTFLR